MTSLRPPNYCPFCGTHQRIGGTGQRHTVYNCSMCHSDYHVEYLGAYPADKQLVCDQDYVNHGGTLDDGDTRRNS